MQPKSTHLFDDPMWMIFLISRVTNENFSFRKNFFSLSFSFLSIGRFENTENFFSIVIFSSLESQMMMTIKFKNFLYTLATRFSFRDKQKKNPISDNFSLVCLFMLSNWRLFFPFFHWRALFIRRVSRQLLISKKCVFITYFSFVRAAIIVSHKIQFAIHGKNFSPAQNFFYSLCWTFFDLCHRQHFMSSFNNMHTHRSNVSGKFKNEISFLSLRHNHFFSLSTEWARLDFQCLSSFLCNARLQIFQIT